MTLTSEPPPPTFTPGSLPSEASYLLGKRSVLLYSSTRISLEAIREDLHVFDELFKVYQSILLNEIRRECPWILHSPNVIGSGSLAWLGTLLLIAGYLKVIKVAEHSGCMAVVMIYLLVDFMLDADEPDIRAIAELKAYMKAFKAETVHVVLETPAVRLIAKYIQDILSVNPNARAIISQAWEAEADSIRQTSSSISLEDVMEITKRKGAVTVMLLAAVIEFEDGTPEEGPPQWWALGEITQLCDDLVDLKLDLASGIHTGATIHAQQKTFDEYIVDILRLIDTFPDDDVLFPYMFCGIVCNCAARNENTSPEMAEVLNMYNLLTSKLDIIEFFETLDLE